MKKIKQKYINRILAKKTYLNMMAYVQITLMIVTPILILIPVHSADAGIRSSVQKALRQFAFNDAGINQDDLARAGVQSSKQNIPKVEIAFTNTEGENYTAVAQVQGIMNPADAYYTWYIKNDNFDRTNKTPPYLPEEDREECEADETEEECDEKNRFPREVLVPGAEYMGDWDYAGLDCDEEFSDNIENKRCVNYQMERYKIAATRAHIATKFDVTRYDSEFNTPGANGDFVVTNSEFPLVDGDLDNPGGLSVGDVEDDNDGAAALVGGSDNFNGREIIDREGRLSTGGDTDNYCYIYDYTLGTAYELVEGNPEAGFRCGVDAQSPGDPDGNIVGDDDEFWSIECLSTITYSTCPVPSNETSSTTTSTTTTTTQEDDPETDEDESLIEETEETEETAEFVSNGTRYRVLQSCDRAPNDARCEYVPGLNFGGVDIAPSGRAYCQGGGIPVCVPRQVVAEPELCTTPRVLEITTLLQDIEDGEEVPEDTGSQQELLEELETLVPGVTDNPALRDQLFTECTNPKTVSMELNDRIATSEICVNPDIYTNANLIQAIRDGEEVPEDAGTEEELLAALDLLIPGDPNDPAVFSAIMAEQRVETDPNSFSCTSQSGSSNFVLPELTERYSLETPVCGVAPPNAPDVDEGELFTEASGLRNICTESIHLAPFPFTDDINKDLYLEDTGFNFITGDGSFTRAEERFWGTSPETAITMGEGINDEEFILGKGLSEFTWEYVEGDEVGVVVEARGIGSTEHDGNNPFVSFVFMSRGCDPKNVGSYKEPVNGRTIEFDTAAMNRDDLNLCLYQNFAQPGTVVENQNLTVEIDGPEGTLVNNQDFIVSFEAAASNENSTLTEAELTARSIYNWKIYYAPGETNPEAQTIQWQRFLDYNLSQSDQELYAERMEMLDLKELKAVGLTELELRANFDVDDPDTTINENEGLLRVTVEINAPTDQPGVTVYGRGENIIKMVTQQRPQLNMYRVAVRGPDTSDEDGGPTPLPLTTIGRNDLSPICDSLGARFAEGEADLDERADLFAEDIACRTFRNEILAFEIPSQSPILPEQVYWEVNGERISCDTTLAPELCQQQPAIVLLPAVQRDGVIQTVTASSSDPAAGLDANEVFSRSFVITPPKVVFEATDGTLTPQSLGSFVPITGDETAATDVERSNTVFVRNADNFNIKAKLDPSILENYATKATSAVSTHSDDRVNVTWEWVGREGEQGESNVIEAVTVPDELSEKPITVQARVTVATPQPIRELLLNKFGIDQYATSPLTAEGEALVHEEGFSTSAYMNDDQYRAYVQGNADKNRTFTATVFGNTASYMLFVLKISLTIGIILFLSSFAMGGITTNDRRRRL